MGNFSLSLQRLGSNETHTHYLAGIMKAGGIIKIALACSSFSKEELPVTKGNGVQ